MGIILQLLGLEKTPEEKQDEIWEARRKQMRADYSKNKESVLREKMVIAITFRCLNCNKMWSYNYPSGIEVGYSNFGSPEHKHGWIMDNFTYDKNLYEYDCPNCDNSNIEIIKRTPIEIKVSQKVRRA